MKKQLTYFLFFALCSFTEIQSQVNRSEFLKNFYKENSYGKLSLLASMPYEEVEEVYPLVKDTLERIKKEVYAQDPEENKNLKFQFDKLEVKKQIYQRNNGQAIYLLENALRNSASNIDDSLTSLTLLKDIFIKIKNVNRALEMNYLIEKKWNRRSEKAKIDFGARKSFLLHLLGMHEEAISELRKEFHQGNNSADTTLLLNFHNDLGVFYNQEKKPDSATANLLRAKQYLKRVRIKKDKNSLADYEFYSGLVDGNLGYSYFLKSNYNDAIPLLKNDAYHSTISSHFVSAFNAYLTLTQCYIQLKNKKLSKLYLDTTQNLLETKLQDLVLKQKFLSTRAEFYMLTHNFQKASESYHEYFRLSDSIFLSEKQINLVNQGLTYNINQREFANEELDKQMKDAQLKDAKERFFRVSLLAGILILLTIILFLSLNNRRIKIREKQLSLKNFQIQTQNTQIEHTLKEKEALIKEIHHRVKNNLQIITSMLNLQIGRIEDEKTIEILIEAKRRINAIALTHQMLYQRSVLSEVNLCEYIESLVRQIEATMSRSNIQIVTELFASDETLTIDGAVPLGLIINELLTNAYKHAFPINTTGRITVSLIDKAKFFLIKVSDTGVGLPENFKQSEKLSLGMELVLILVEQLESELIVENKNGSTFMFEIKKNNHKLHT